MFDVSSDRLRILAAILWYSGVVVLFAKASSLLLQARAINPEPLWLWMIVVVGLVLGMVKGKYLFSKACKKNLKRINRLENPKLWQFYRMPFFIFLLVMVLMGSYLSKMAMGDYRFLLSVAVVDISIATALLFGGYYFWK